MDVKILSSIAALVQKNLQTSLLKDFKNICTKIMTGIKRDTEIHLGNLSEAGAAEVTAASNVNVKTFHEQNT